MSSQFVWGYTNIRFHKKVWCLLALLVNIHTCRFPSSDGNYKIVVVIKKLISNYCTKRMTFLFFSRMLKETIVVGVCMGKSFINILSTSCFQWNIIWKFHHNILCLFLLNLIGYLLSLCQYSTVLEIEKSGYNLSTHLVPTLGRVVAWLRNVCQWVESAT